MVKRRARRARPTWWTRAKRAYIILFLTTVSAVVGSAMTVEEWARFHKYFGLIVAATSTLIQGITRSAPDAAVSDAEEKTADRAADKTGAVK